MTEPNLASDITRLRGSAPQPPVVLLRDLLGPTADVTLGLVHAGTPIDLRPAAMPLWTEARPSISVTTGLRRMIEAAQEAMRAANEDLWADLRRPAFWRERIPDPDDPLDNLFAAMDQNPVAVRNVVRLLTEVIPKGGPDAVAVERALRLRATTEARLFDEVVECEIRWAVIAVIADRDTSQPLSGFRDRAGQRVTMSAMGLPPEEFWTWIIRTVWQRLGSRVLLRPVDGLFDPAGEVVLPWLDAPGRGGEEGRRPRLGRPRGSGAFHNRDDFLAAIVPVIRSTMQREGYVTQERAAWYLSQDSRLPSCDVSTLRYWLRRYGLDWQTVVAIASGRD